MDADPPPAETRVHLSVHSLEELNKESTLRAVVLQTGEKHSDGGRTSSLSHLKAQGERWLGHILFNASHLFYVSHKLNLR